MVWFFQRANQVLELETRYDNATSEYVLEQRMPDATSRVERFPDVKRFRQRLLEVEGDLNSQQWLPQGAPVILPGGWPDSTPRR